MSRTYTRDDVVAAIVTAIEAGGGGGFAYDEYDVDAIADEQYERNGGWHPVTSDAERDAFWESVEAHALP